MDKDPNFPIDIDKHAERVMELPAVGGLTRTWHRFDAISLQAINVAIAAGRPLLVRGEPGTGKSQLARAAAELLGRHFACKVVDAHTEVADLFYSFDAVERLARAQVAGALRVGEVGADELMEQLEEGNFLRPGPLWWAFDWAGAATQDAKYRRRRSTGKAEPIAEAQAAEDGGYVILIDEIDKTDPSVPNGLLEALGQWTFGVPGGGSICLDEGRIPPLVVITTNEERELPGAFVRRCMVLQIHLPTDDSDLRAWLCRRGKTHFPDLADALLDKAAGLVSKDRRAALKLGITAPGQAEYLDMLRAVRDLGRTDAERERLLDEIAVFALKKHPDMHPDADKARR